MEIKRINIEYSDVKNDFDKYPKELEITYVLQAWEKLKRKKEVSKKREDYKMVNWICTETKIPVFSYENCVEYNVRIHF